MGSSEESAVEEIVHQAERLEKEYEWLKAAESYEEALKLIPDNDCLRIGQIYEHVGQTFHRAAMQAESQEEFRERLQRSIGAYEKAHGFYGGLIAKEKTALMLRCEAVIKYLGYWLTAVPSEKRKLLDECLELAKSALAVFRDSGSKLEFSRTYNELRLVFIFRLWLSLEWEWNNAKSIVETGVEWGERALEMLSEAHDTHEIAKTRVTLAFCYDLLGSLFIEGLEEQEKNRLKIVKSLIQIVDLQEKDGDAYILGWANALLGDNTGGEEAVKHSEKTLACGKLTRDNIIIGRGLNILAYAAHWKAMATEDPDKRKELLEKTMQLYDEALDRHSIMSLMNLKDAGSMTIPAGHIAVYDDMARNETDPEKRLALLEKAEKEGMEALKAAEDSELMSSVISVLFMLSGTLLARARLETDARKKRSRLEMALKYREKEIKLMEQVGPFQYWNVGVSYETLAGIKEELANIEQDPDGKRRLLEESVLIEEKCLALCSKNMSYYERMGELNMFSNLGKFEDSYARLLLRLYDLTSKPEQLRKAIQVSQKAIESAGKLGLISLIAESHWKIARAQDNLEEHLEAAGSFERASEAYMKAEEKIPRLKDLYEAQASYMRAWSEIERARHNHERQEYGLAKEHFERAAELHKSLKRWSYLEPNYSAWAKVEEAEELSRKEQSEEAAKAFDLASNLFSEAKKSAQVQLSTIEDDDEKQMATSIVKASILRKEYCDARIAIEEAKILDKKGDHFGSSRKYDAAAEAFEKITQTLESEQEQKEFRSIISLSRAWQKMMLGDARTSPESYSEASALFEQASKESSSEVTSLLALGHSRFCRALEAGTRFADTGDAAMQKVAMQNLEVAAKYYVKAGFQSASEYAKATGLLFEAYVHMDTAKGEKDPEKKTKLYLVAEKVLQTAAGSFMKAEHPEKREQVLRLLEKVREERELALSITEVLQTPSIVSTTASFSTPTPTSEEAVGSERFEHADVQANLIVRQREVKVGQELGMELEFVNAGKGSALLTKVTEIIPKGFEVAEKPETCRVEDSFIDLKGKRLNPLKTEEVRLVLKPTVQGTFSIKPTVLYLDENGKYKTHEPEPVTVTVKELGIKGWIKGER
jgi:hypothetical protein